MFSSFLSCVALSVSVVGLERALLQYCSQPNDQPFDIKTVPIETVPSITEGPRCKSSGMEVITAVVNFCGFSVIRCMNYTFFDEYMALC